MLTYFSVKNFKGFEKDLVLDLSNASNYSFSENAVKNGFIKTALVYGQNGCGKSNLGLAIADIITHLTDKQKLFNKYPVYLNLNSANKFASFEYHFTFAEDVVLYKYEKYDVQSLKSEELIINNNSVIRYNFDKNEGFCKLDGTETLKLDAIDNKLSVLKFIKSNANLPETNINLAFKQMLDFVDHMLLFYSLTDRGYQGLQLGVENLDDYIVRTNNLNNFEAFLKKAGVKEKLAFKELNGKKVIGLQYKYGTIPFAQAASTGTNSLELLYYWICQMAEASFVFIDEFDAFYHYELSEMVVRELLKRDVQVILTTHNTDLINNDILRPDCYFVLKDGNITSFADLTVKEIRKAHNIQKMFKAGVFDE